MGKIEWKTKEEIEEENENRPPSEMDKLKEMLEKQNQAIAELSLLLSLMQ